MVFRRKAAPPKATRIDLASPSSVENAVDAIFGHTLENGYTFERTDPSRVSFLRISSFPFCARAWWLSQATSRNRKRETSVIGGYFTGVGTKVHSIIQDGLATIAGR